MSGGGQGDNLTVNPGDVVVCTYTNTYNKTTPNAVTTLHNANGGAALAAGTPHLPLGSSVYDTAQITATDGQPLIGTLTYELFTGTTCNGTLLHTDTGIALGGQSTATGALGAGGYSFHAEFVANNDSAHNTRPSALASRSRSTRRSLGSARS